MGGGSALACCGSGSGQGPRTIHRSMEPGAGASYALTHFCTTLTPLLHHFDTTPAPEGNTMFLKEMPMFYKYTPNLGNP